MNKYFKLVLSGTLMLFVLFLEPITNWVDDITRINLDFVVYQKRNLLIIIFTWFSIQLIRIIKTKLLEQYDITIEDNLESRKRHTQVNILERVIVSVTVILAVALILISFESIREIGFGIFASAGVAGIIIGLSAQKVVGALLAGIQIAITQPFRIDDAVLVENEWGWIEEINLTYVVVRIWDKRRLVLPSTYFLEKPFQN